MRRSARESGRDDTLAFDDFMALALYHPELGYYRRERPRVGRSAETDFYTATSSGPLFGELIVAACVKLLGPQAAPHAFTFVEIGAEPGGGILREVAHPFAAAHTLRVGEPLDLQPFTHSNNSGPNSAGAASRFKPLVGRSRRVFLGSDIRQAPVHSGRR